MISERKKNNILQLIFILSILLWVANIWMIGGPGQMVFLAGDMIPSMIFGEMKSDYLMPVGLYYGFIWPLLLILSYAIASAVKVPKRFSESPRLFLAMTFFMFIGVSTVALSTFFHLKSPW